MKLLAILAIISLALVCDSDARDINKTKRQLEQFCRLSRSAPVLTKVSEVDSVGHLLDFGVKSRVDCNENVAKAIRRLNRVTRLTDVCSQESADKIVKFWTNYVRSKAENRLYLPRQLRKFFIAYGMQVSKLCKKTMIEHLEKASKEREVTEMDIKLVTEDVRELINFHLGDDWRLENLLLVVQTEENQDDEIAKVGIGPLKREIFSRIRERCIKKLKPVYFDLITPIVKLAAIGLNYKGDSMRAKMKAFESEKIYRDWFAAIVSCEIVLRIEVVVIPKQVEESDGTIKQITVLDEDDLKELESKGLAREEPKLVLKSSYKTRVYLNDLVLDKNDTDLIQSTKRYKGFLSEVDKFQLRMVKRTIQLARDTINPALIKWGLHSDNSQNHRTGGLVRKFKFTPGQKLLMKILLAAGVIVGAILIGFLFATGIGQTIIVTIGFCLLFSLVFGLVVRRIEKSVE